MAVNISASGVVMRSSIGRRQRIAVVKKIGGCCSPFCDEKLLSLVVELLASARYVVWKPIEMIISRKTPNNILMIFTRKVRRANFIKIIWRGYNLARVRKNLRYSSDLHAVTCKQSHHQHPPLCLAGCSRVPQYLHLTRENRKGRPPSCWKTPPSIELWKVDRQPLLS